VAAQIGMAEQALGLWVAAEKDLREGLAQENDPWIKRNRAALEDALGFIGGHLANLDVWGPPEGAEIFPGGDLLGTAPLPGPLRVPVGNPELMVKATGFAPVRRPLDVKPGANVREHVTLRALALEAPPPPAPEAAAVKAPPTESEAAQDAPDDSSVFGRWWFWTAVGVVAVGAGVGTYLLLHKDDGCMASPGKTCSNYNL